MRNHKPRVDVKALIKFIVGHDRKLLVGVLVIVAVGFVVHVVIADVEREGVRKPIEVIGGRLHDDLHGLTFDMMS